MKDNIQQWWKNLNLREQVITGGGGAIAIVLLFYLFIWSPFTASLITTKNYVLYQQNLVAWMQQAEQKLQTLTATGNTIQKISNSDLLTTLDTTLKQHQLAAFMNGMQQTDNNTVLVRFNKVPFDSLIAWINSLWNNYEIKVQQINIIPKPEKNGLVAAQVYFVLAN